MVHLVDAPYHIGSRSQKKTGSSVGTHTAFSYTFVHPTPRRVPRGLVPFTLRVNQSRDETRPGLTTPCRTRSFLGEHGSPARVRIAQAVSPPFHPVSARHVSGRIQHR
uniref:Uncharacterized protein n=1 Tax=Lupinus angustifolius TaxID=3871 RepID=A0A172GY41_LUPAN|nr:hypothetical protein [Lupinus angustifolius]